MTSVRLLPIPCRRGITYSTGGMGRNIQYTLEEVILWKYEIKWFGWGKFLIDVSYSTLENTGEFTCQPTRVSVFLWWR